MTVRGHRNHRHLGTATQGAQRTRSGKAIHHRHLAIEQHRIHPLAAQQLDSLRAVVGRAHLITELEQHAAGHQLVDGIVFHHQHHALTRLTHGRALTAQAWRRLLGARAQRQANRHAQGETAALAWLAALLQLAAQQQGQLAAQGQTDTQTAVFAGHRTVQLAEALEQGAAGLLGKADAAVLDLHAQGQPAAAGLFAMHPQDHPPLLGELHRVVQQVAEHLGQLGGIAFEGIGQAVVQLQFEVQALVVGTPGKLHAQAVEQRAQAERLASRVQLAGLQLGEREDVVDHVHHVARRAHGRLVVLGQLDVHGHRLHQLQRADHAVHRGAQFMGHGGEELVL